MSYLNTLDIYTYQKIYKYIYDDVISDLNSRFSYMYMTYTNISDAEFWICPRIHTYNDINLHYKYQTNETYKKNVRRLLLWTKFKKV